MEDQQHTKEVRLIAIGNSKGIRLPKELIQKYGWDTKIALEVLDEGVMLKTSHPELLSWEQTYRDMAAEGEDWSDFEETAGDGLE